MRGSEIFLGLFLNYRRVQVFFFEYHISQFLESYVIKLLSYWLPKKRLKTAFLRNRDLTMLIMEGKQWGSFEVEISRWMDMKKQG